MTEVHLSFNRFTQTWSDVLPEGTVISSQVILQGPIELDRQGFSGRVLLVDNEEDSTLVETRTARARVQVQQGDQRESMKAALDIADRVRQWQDAGTDWPDVVSAVDPLILLADIEDLLIPDVVEDALADNSPQLRAVFHSPFSELEFTAERMPAPRARRFSRRAMQVLAARSEDWIRAGASGIKPRTVEALVRDEVVDVYENRVAARLIDDVRRHLKGVLSVYSEFSPLVQVIQGPYRKQNRLASLWGRVPPSDDLRGALKRRQQRLEELLRFTDELLVSQLYEGVPRRTRVGQPIRMTNLLLQDSNYRGVRRLWLEWWRARGDVGSIEARRAEQLSEAEAFFQFALLVVCRALLNLGDLDAAATPVETTVNTRWGELRLEQSTGIDNGSWWFTVPGQGYRSIVIAVAAEVLSGSDTEVRRRLEQLTGGVTVSGCRDVFVLVPGTKHDLDQVRGALDGAVGVDPLSTGRSEEGNVWVIPVSPLDLESTERVERAMRWAVLSSSWLSYPPTLLTPSIVEQAIGSRSFLEPITGSRETAVIAVPAEREVSDLQHLLDQQARRSRQQLRGRGSADAEQLERFSAELRKAFAHLGMLTACPVCGNEATLVARSTHTFESTCRTCSARWGLRHDPVSDHRIPYLWLGEDLKAHPSGQELGAWLGRDVVAEPCRHIDAEYGSDLINPWTGRCTAAGRWASTCERCVRLG